MNQRKVLRRVMSDCGDNYLVPLDRRLRRRQAKQFIHYYVKGERKCDAFGAMDLGQHEK